MAELAEGARLLSEYPGKLGSRVQIPLSPPEFLLYKNSGEISSKGYLAFDGSARRDLTLC
jgi:hypothetical protein